MRNYDLEFLKHFSMVLGFLILVTLGLIAAAHHLHGLIPPEVSPVAARQTQARIGARERGVQTGACGSPGDVALVEIGSRRTAFALSSAFTNMGWTTESVSLHQADDDRFVERLNGQHWLRLDL